MSDETTQAINEMLYETPLDRERVKKAKRLRNILIVVIILLVAALSALVYLGYTIYMESVERGTGRIGDVTTVIDGDVVDASAPPEIKIETTSIPNLSSLFGLTTDEVAARLGSSFLLASLRDESDETNPAIRQLATFSFVPTVSGGTGDMMANLSLPNETIYASLDASGKVVDIYYICDMRLLGYPDRAFVDLLADQDFVTSVLSSANVQPRDFSFVAPDPDESTIYDNPSSANRKVIKQTHIFSGRTLSSSVPTVWTLTVTYDFGTGVASTGEFRQATRSINLKLA